MTITENMIYDACVEINLDPLQFRRDNLQRAGWENHYGQVSIINITTTFIVIVNIIVVVIIIIILIILLRTGDGRERRGHERLSR